MYKQHEIFSFIICFIVFLFVLKNKKELRRLPNINFFIIGFYSFFVSTIANITEEFFLYKMFNLIEHLSIGLSIFFTFLWFYTNRKLKIK